MEIVGRNSLASIIVSRKRPESMIFRFCQELAKKLQLPRLSSTSLDEINHRPMSTLDCRVEWKCGRPRRLRLASGRNGRTAAI
jgi:hypothetical protein